VPREPCTITGRAWSGMAPVEKVEVSVDGGATWSAADLDPPDGPHAWRMWRFDWLPDAPGELELCCRARDALGNEQPLAQPWNLQGYANNAVQRVPVVVS
jgi:hypothetical protein